MTRIYIIRHAEAEGNLYRRAQGHYDGKITAQGYRQIDALAERFRDVHLDAVYSSDLFRTVTTAGAILKYHDLTLNTDPRLREVCMGVWEGMAWGDIEAMDGEQLEKFGSDPASWHVSGGETFEALAERVTGAVLDIASRHDGQTIAIVSHGMAIRSLLCRAKGLPLSSLPQVRHGDNTAVSLLEAENGVLTVVFMNDVSHLNSDTSTFAKQTWWQVKPQEKQGRNNLRFVMMNPSKEKKLYIACYEDAWRESHNGTAEGFQGNIYWETAMRRAREEPRSVWKAYCDGEFAGILELDTRSEAVNGVGWISLCYLRPEFRGRRLGIQLIGQAVFIFRSMGRKRIGLHTAETNTRAIGFYEHYGFKKAGTVAGVLGPLYRMEMEL